MRTSKINPITVLDSLSPATVAALDSHYENKIRGNILASITKQLGGKAVVNDDETVEAPAKSGNKVAATPKKRGPKAKRGPGSLGLTSDGRTASDVIRDYDAENPDVPAAEVVAHCHELGLTRVVPANVYNVRQLVKKAAEADAPAKRGPGRPKLSAAEKARRAEEREAIKVAEAKAAARAERKAAKEAEAAAEAKAAAKAAKAKAAKKAAKGKPGRKASK